MSDRPTREALLALIAELTDPDPCWYDHHDYCQAHGLGDKPCPHERAKEILASDPDVFPGYDAGFRAGIEAAAARIRAFHDAADTRPKRAVFARTALHLIDAVRNLKPEDGA